MFFKKVNPGQGPHDSASRLASVLSQAQTLESRLKILWDNQDSYDELVSDVQGLSVILKALYDPHQSPTRNDIINNVKFTHVANKNHEHSYYPVYFSEEPVIHSGYVSVIVGKFFDAAAQQKAHPIVIREVFSIGALHTPRVFFKFLIEHALPETLTKNHALFIIRECLQLRLPSQALKLLPLLSQIDFDLFCLNLLNPKTGKPLATLEKFFISCFNDYYPKEQHRSYELFRAVICAMSYNMLDLAEQLLEVLIPLPFSVQESTNIYEENRQFFEKMFNKNSKLIPFSYRLFELSATHRPLVEKFLAKSQEDRHSVMEAIDRPAWFAIKIYSDKEILEPSQVESILTYLASKIAQKRFEKKYVIALMALQKYYPNPIFIEAMNHIVFHQILPESLLLACYEDLQKNQHKRKKLVAWVKKISEDAWKHHYNYTPLDKECCNRNIATLIDLFFQQDDYPKRAVGQDPVTDHCNKQLLAQYRRGIKAHCDAYLFQRNCPALTIMQNHHDVTQMSNEHPAILTYQTPLLTAKYDRMLQQHEQRRSAVKPRRRLLRNPLERPSCLGNNQLSCSLL